MSTRNIKMTAERWLSIDVLRALSIIFMIQNHFLYFLSPWKTFIPDSGLDHVWRWWVGGDLWAAQMFLFLSGFSVYLWVQKHSAMSAAVKQKFLIKRGLILCVLGIAMSYAVESFIINDVLLVIGLSALVLAAFLNYAGYCLLFLMLVLVVITPFLQDWSQFFLLPFAEVDWATRNLEFSGWEYYKEIFTNYALRGYQPIIPWIVFPLFGFFWAKMVHQKSLKTVTTRTLITSLSAFSLGGGFSFLSWQYLQAFSLYPLTTATLFFSLGVLVMSLYLFFMALDVFKKFRLNFIISFFQIYSRFSLTIYVFHLTFLVALMGCLSWPTGLDFWLYYGRALTVEQTVLGAWLFILLFYFVLRQWYRFNNGRYSLEWWLRRLS